MIQIIKYYKIDINENQIDCGVCQMDFYKDAYRIINTQFERAYEKVFERICIKYKYLLKYLNKERLKNIQNGDFVTIDDNSRMVSRT